MRLGHDFQNLGIEGSEESYPAVDDAHSALPASDGSSGGMPGDKGV